MARQTVVEDYPLLGINVHGYRIMAEMGYNYDVAHYYFTIQKHLFWCFWYTIKRDMSYKDAVERMHYLSNKETVARYVVNLSKERAKNG